jgi:predicted metalloprotease
MTILFVCFRQFCYVDGELSAKYKQNCYEKGMKTNRELANKIKLRYGTAKLVAEELGIKGSTARMRIRNGNVEAIRLAIQIEQQQDQKAAQEVKEILAFTNHTK